MTLDYYLYALMDSSKNGPFIYGDYYFEYEPFYIGKGRGNRIKDTIYDKSPFKCNKIKNLKKRRIKIISIKIEDSLSNEDAMMKEIEMISIIGRRDNKKGPLVNTTDGGEGRLNSKHSEETKKIISINRRGKGIGWKHSDETLSVMKSNQSGHGNGFYGKKHTEITKNEQSLRVSGKKHPMYGKKHDKETIDKLKKHRNTKISNDVIKESCQSFNKPVLMFDLNLNLLNSFNSVKEASKETGINESIISKCCRGDIKNPTRFYFRYKNKEDNIKNNNFLINIGDFFYVNRVKYKLLKRNKKTCECLVDDEEKTLHVKDFNILFEKSTNNIDMIELYLFIKSIDNSFKIKDDLIYSNNFIFRYLKLKENSELFNKNLNNDNSNFVIFSDEWENKKDIVKSRILNLFKKSKKIWARKCEIKEIRDNELVRSFLKKNHIQGFVGSKIKLGLFYNGELVSIMTFGNLRKNMGQTSKKGSYELLRFCNKLNTTVVGGASRLFNYFLSNYDSSYVLSYADRRWSIGILYENLGFNFNSKTIPNYYYIIDDKREYRFKFRKDILIRKGFDANKTEIEIMNSGGFYRIFDKGSLKYEYFNYG
jgi:group I intron endonuclease